MGVLDEFAAYQQQIQEINAVRAQNAGNGNAAAHNQITYSQKNIALKRARSSANSAQQYRTWMQKTFNEQEHRTSKIQEVFEKTQYKINKMLGNVIESMQTVTKDIIATFNPERLAETNTDQFRTFLYILGTSAIATNISKITDWVKNIAGFFGIGEREDGKTFKDVLSGIAYGENGHGFLDSLTKIVRSPIDYLIQWIKGEFELRATMMKKVKMPTLEPVSLGTLGSDLLPFGRLFQSVSSYIYDVFNSFSQKVNAFFNPSEIGTVMGNNVVKANAEETRNIKANELESEDSSGTLYVYGKRGTEVKSNNTVNFIPKVFLNEHGGLTGTVGSMLGASRQVYSLYSESMKAGKIDTSSLVHTLNMMYDTVKQKGYIIVEAAFLNTFPPSLVDKFKNPQHEIKIYIVKGNRNVLELIGIGLVGRDSDYNSTYYLTEDEWNRLNEESQKKLRVLGTTTAYKLTEEEFNQFAKENYNVDNFDSTNNSTFITYAQESLKSVQGAQLDENKRQEMVAVFGEENMDDTGIENVYAESQATYEEADAKRKEDLENSEAAQTLDRLGEVVGGAVRRIFRKEENQDQVPVPPGDQNQIPGIDREGIDYSSLDLNPDNLNKPVNYNDTDYQNKAEWIRQNSSLIYTILGGKARRVSSYWGEGRSDHKHAGIDLAVDENTPIYAPEDGTIQNVNEDASTRGGKHIFLRSEDGKRTYFFCHLNSTAKKTDGEHVKRGQLISYSGNTGQYSTGPHLHFEVKVNDKKVDPLQFIETTEGLNYNSTGTRSANPPESTSPWLWNGGSDSFSTEFSMQAQQNKPLQVNPPEVVPTSVTPVPSDVNTTTTTSTTAAQVQESTATQTTAETKSDELAYQKIQANIDIKKTTIQAIGLAGEELASKIDATNQILSSKQNSGTVDVRRR